MHEGFATAITLTTPHATLSLEVTFPPGSK